jgi:hypothetical protein
MRIVVVGGIRLSCEGLTHFLRRSQASPAPSPLADESPYHGARRVQPILPDVSGSRDRHSRDRAMCPLHQPHIFPGGCMDMTVTIPRSGSVAFLTDGPSGWRIRMMSVTRDVDVAVGWTTSAAPTGKFSSTSATEELLDQLRSLRGVRRSPPSRPEVVGRPIPGGADPRPRPPVRFPYLWRQTPIITRIRLEVPDVR